MSKHRAADTTLTLTPLAERLTELAERSAAQSIADPRFVAVHDHIAQIADVVRQAMAVMAVQHQQLEYRYDALLAQLERQTARADEMIASSAAAREALDDGAGLLAEVRAMRAELQGAAGLLTGAQAVLEAGVRRMQTSGDALVRYLDDRDIALEAERDRVLRDVLEDFAASLHARERRTVARRLMDVVDRRRDARDAARWRREHAETAGRAPQAAANGTGPRVIDLDAAAKLRRPSYRR
jgi:hypothetical protein